MPKTSMAQVMGEHEKADEARKGLIDSIKGKAKEIAGAVTGNDSLTAEGQLEQTAARARKEAGAIDAVADAESESATDLLSQAGHQAAGARDVVRSGAEALAERPPRWKKPMTSKPKPGAYVNAPRPSPMEPTCPERC